MTNIREGSVPRALIFIASKIKKWIIHSYQIHVHYT